MRAWNAVIAATLAILASSATPMFAADHYPTRPITLIVPYGAGGAADASSRLITKFLSQKLGQPVIVDNKAGGGGILGMDVAANAKPDGYTLIFTSSGQMATYPWLYKKLSYSPAKSFVGIRAGASNPHMLVFNPNKPYKTLAEFLDYAKKNPNAINYGSVGTGSSGHLAGEMLQQLTGIKMTHIPYKTSPMLYNDLLAGVLDVGFDFPSAMRGHIETGKMIAIALAHPERISNFPNVPTFGELGFPNMEFATWGAFLAPAGTPEPIIQKLDAAIAAALKTQPLIDYYNFGDSIVLDIGHGDFPAFLAREQTKMKALVEASGATAD
jgi:tripartite-type tricarboxylate transporter receptor subunit TctC